MQLNNFSSYFEIMAGLNLAYATSDWFQSAIDKKVQKIDLIKSWAEKKIELIRSKSEVVEQFGTNSDLIQQNLDALNKKLARSDKIKEDEQTFEKVKKGYRSIFLMTSLYCFTVILLGGFEQFFYTRQPELASKLQAQHVISNTFLFLLHFGLIYNILIFIRSNGIRIRRWVSYDDDQNGLADSSTKSLLHRILNHESETNRFLVVVLWLIWVILLYNAVATSPGYLFSFKETWRIGYIQTAIPWGSKTNITISLVLALSAYLLHFFRVYLHDVRYFYQLRIFHSELESMIGQFEQNVERYAINNQPLPVPTPTEPTPVMTQWEGLKTSAKSRIVTVWFALRRRLEISVDTEGENDVFHECCLKSTVCRHDHHR